MIERQQQTLVCGWGDKKQVMSLRVRHQENVPDYEGRDLCELKYEISLTRSIRQPRNSLAQSYRRHPTL